METSFKNDVKITNSGILLTDFLINEPQLVSYFAEKHEKDPKNISKLYTEIIDLLNLGYVANKSIDISKKIDYIDESFKGFTKNIQNKIDNDFSFAMKDKLMDFIGEDGTFTKTLLHIFGEEGIHSEKINKLIEENQNKMNSILNINDTKSPIYELKKSMDEKYAEIYTYMISREKTKEVIENTPLKGFVFEELVHKILASSLMEFNCLLENTTDTSGTSGKKGDFVLTKKDTKQKIVIEAKKLKSDPKTKDVITVLETSIKNRTADYGIYIYCDSNEDTIPELGMFNQIHDNKLFVVVSESDNYTATEKIIKLACVWAFQHLKINKDEDLESLQKFDDLQNNIKERLKKVKEIRIHSKNITSTCNKMLNDMGVDLGLIIEKE